MTLCLTVIACGAEPKEPPYFSELKGELKSANLPTSSKEYLQSFPADSTNQCAELVAVLDSIPESLIQHDLLKIVAPTARGLARLSIPAEHRAEVTELLKEQNSVLRRLHDTIPLAQGYLPLPPEVGWETSLPLHACARAAGSLLALQALQALEDGKVKEAGVAIERCVQLGRFLRKDRLIIGCVMGMSLHDLSVGMLEELLLRGPPGPDVFNQLRSVFSSFPSSGSLRSGVLSDLAVAVDVTLGSPADYARFIEEMAKDGKKNTASSDAVLKGALRMRETGQHKRDVEFCFQALRRYLNADSEEFPKRLETAAEIGKEVQMIKVGKPDQVLVYSGMTLPVVGSFFTRHAHTELRWRAACYALELESHRLARASLPHGSPSTASAIPKDVWTGSPLEVRTENGVTAVYRPNSASELPAAPPPTRPLFRLRE